MLTLARKSVLVTGGAGFIGSHLVDRIIAESPGNVVVVDNLFLGKEKNLDQARRAFPQLRLYREDATSYEAIGRLIRIEDVEIVFNLAVVPLPTSLERPKWTVDTNVAITTGLCELLREGYYRTLVHFSSSETYGSAQAVPMDEKHPLVPTTPYAASKAASDHLVLSYCRTFGVDVAIVRPFNTFGPRQNSGVYAGVIPVVIRCALERKPVVIYGDGEQTRDFIFVRDVAEAAVRVYEQPATRGQVLNIATGQERAINNVVQQILEILDDDVPILHAPCRLSDVRRHCGGINLARMLIEFEPQTAVNEGLRETVAWYKQERAAVSGVHAC